MSVEPPVVDVDATATDVEAALGGEVELRRLHPLTPIMRSWRLVGAAGAIGLGVFRDELDKLKWFWQALHGDVEVGVLFKGVLILIAVAAVSLTFAWLSWRATGFAIVQDANGVSTLLYHSGVLVRQRRQVRLNRVQSVDVNQPLFPRVLGLAAVRLDMAAGDEASVDLAYLRQPEAWELRTEILRHTSAGVTPLTQQPSHQRPDALVAQVSTSQVVYANLLDGVATWLFALAWLIGLVLVVVIWGEDALVAALSGIIPVTIAIFSLTRRQITSMLRDANFQLHRTATGIRVSSGLTSVTNRTIDFDRIQGIRLEEPFLWRRFGWARVLVDVAGAKGDGEHAASLMPVADRQVALSLIADVTGAHLDQPAYADAGERSRTLDPWGWRFLGVALLDLGAVRRAGRWRRTTSYVPYARVQSVSAHQGLLQRRLGLATVYLDLPKGAERCRGPGPSSQRTSAPAPSQRVGPALAGRLHGCAEVGNRRAVEEALSIRAAGTSGESLVVCGLDVLGYHLVSEGAAELSSEVEDLEAAVVVARTYDQLAVELDPVDRQIGERRQRRMPSAEVIKQDPDSCTPKLAKRTKERFRLAR
jgi:putative membrane protein